MPHVIEMPLRARRAPRRIVRMEAELIASRWDSPRRHSVLDVGPDGLRVLADELLAEGEHVVVAFRPPGGRLAEVTAFARIAHARRAGMGLELLDLATDARAELVRAIHRPWRTASPAPIAHGEWPTVEEGEIAPAALGGLLTGGRRSYRWRYEV